MLRKKQRGSSANYMNRTELYLALLAIGFLLAAFLLLHSLAYLDSQTIPDPKNYNASGAIGAAKYQYRHGGYGHETTR